MGKSDITNTDILIIYKHMKNHFISLVVRDTKPQIYNFTPTSVAKNQKDYLGSGSVWTLIYSWWDIKLCDHFGKLWQFKNINAI